MKELWEKFWYEYIPPDDISFGAARRGRLRFRQERLIAVIVTIWVIITLLR